MIISVSRGACMLYGMAGVVELADTLALGASARKSVGVQISLPAHPWIDWTAI